MQEFLSSTVGQIIIQGIGFLAMAVGVLSLQAKHRGGILAMQTLSCLLWVVQFVLMNNPAGALLNAVGVLRNILYNLRTTCKSLDKPILPIGFVIISAASGLFTFRIEGWPAFLPALAMIIASIAFYLKDEFTIRILSFLISPPWIIYHAIAFNIGGVLNEVFCIASIIIALARYGKGGNHSKENCEKNSKRQPHHSETAHG